MIPCHDSRDSTGMRKHRQDIRSISLKIHWPSTPWPRWYFRHPIFDSSITTTLPIPPVIIIIESVYILYGNNQ